MLRRLFVHVSILVFMLLGASLAQAQTGMAVSVAQQDDVSAREAYLKREDAFMSRMNFTAQQKETYKALVEKRNAALKSFEPGVKNIDANGVELTRKQVVIDFKQGLEAMLNEQQRSKMRVESRNVTAQ